MSKKMFILCLHLYLSVIFNVLCTPFFLSHICCFFSSLVIRLFDPFVILSFTISLLTLYIGYLTSLNVSNVMFLIYISLNRSYKFSVPLVFLFEVVYIKVSKSSPLILLSPSPLL